VSLNLTERSRLATTQVDLDRLDRQLKIIGAEQAKLDAVLRKPKTLRCLTVAYS
jgi:hypothetical protein